MVRADEQNRIDGRSNILERASIMVIMSLLLGQQRDARGGLDVWVRRPPHQPLQSSPPLLLPPVQAPLPLYTPNDHL